jgi:hypothetical protein
MHRILRVSVRAAVVEAEAAEAPQHLQSRHHETRTAQ